MRITVVGSGGYVGTALCERLEDRGETVQRIDAGLWGQPLHPATVQESDEGPITQAIGDFKAELVYYLAATAHDLTGSVVDGEFNLNNVVKPLRVTSYCTEYLKIPVVHTSSLSVFSEQTSGYPESKRELERRLIRDTDYFRLVHILRFGTLYGWMHDKWPVSWRGHLLLNKMAHDAVTKGEIVVNDPHAHRPVLELYAAVEALLEAGWPGRPRGEIRNLYSVCGTVREFAGAVKQVALMHGYHVDIKAGDGAKDQRDYSFGSFWPMLLQAPLHTLIHQIKNNEIIQG